MLSLAGAATSMSFVATRLLSPQKMCLSRQNYVCRNKTFFEANICHDKLTVVATKDSILFLRQKNVFTKIILAAAPAHDNILGSVGRARRLAYGLAN